MPLRIGAATSAPKHHDDRHDARQDLRDAAQQRQRVRSLAGRLRRHEHLRARSRRWRAPAEQPFPARPRVAVGVPHADPPAVGARREPAGRADVVVKVESIFFRWAPPRTGFEVYAEYGRDDFWLDRRELLQEPDHLGGYTIGFEKVWGSGLTLHAIRAELQDLQPSLLAQARGVVPFYIHGTVRQGHTERGQLLGSYAGFGGAGGIAALETYYPGGRWTLSWTRILQRQRGAFFPDSILDSRG